MHDWHKLLWINRASCVVSTAGLTCFLAVPASLLAEEPIGVQPLLSIRLSEIRASLPSDTHVLFESDAIEQFLSKLDDGPPDWKTVYGHGHHDPGHDERLFNLNRDRDAKREGKDARHWRIAFLWSGELSKYDPENGGFHVALGPKFTPTNWGVVRFKYEDLSGNLIAVPTIQQRAALQPQVEQGQSIDINVVMVGTLIPEESIVYDFSHDQEGLGLIMPVVRIESVVYLLPSGR